MEDDQNGSHERAKPERGSVEGSQGDQKVIDGLVRGSVRGWADLSSKDIRKIIEGQKKVLLKAVVRNQLLGR
jgi:hypothetical protein